MEQGLGFVSLTVDIICFRNFYIVNQHIADLAQGHNLVDALLVQQIQPLQGVDIARLRLCRPGRPAAPGKYGNAFHFP